MQQPYRASGGNRQCVSWRSKSILRFQPWSAESIHSPSVCGFLAPLLKVFAFTESRCLDAKYRRLAGPVRANEVEHRAFDLLELNGEDLRHIPIETRKSTLKSLLRGKHAGIAFNAHFIADGAIVYRQACALGCEGIVSKRLGSRYRSGRADCWLKVKNPAAPAVTRETEEEWN
jgi:hypothetical protein